MNFGTALAALRSGFPRDAPTLERRGHVARAAGSRREQLDEPRVYLSDACGELVPWTASQTHVLADDWLILEPDPPALPRVPLRSRETKRRSR